MVKDSAQNLQTKTIKKNSKLAHHQYNNFLSNFKVHSSSKQYSICDCIAYTILIYFVIKFFFHLYAFKFRRHVPQLYFVKSSYPTFPFTITSYSFHSQGVCLICRHWSTWIAKNRWFIILVWAQKQHLSFTTIQYLWNLSLVVNLPWQAISKTNKAIGRTMLL